MAVRAIIDEPV